MDVGDRNQRTDTGDRLQTSGGGLAGAEFFDALVELVDLFSNGGQRYSDGLHALSSLGWQVYGGEF